MLNNLDVNQQIALISAGAALLGSIIGAVATLLGTLLTRKLQKSGKVALHVRPVYSQSKSKHFSGFYQSQEKAGLYMHIPLWLDAVNTSGVPRILRNVNLYAYREKTEIAEFTQTQRIGDGDSAILLGDHESYTLVVPENSARRFNLEFILHEQEIKAENKNFDELVFSYFDEKDRVQAFHFTKIDSCWSEGPLNIKRKWISMKKRCRYAR